MRVSSRRSGFTLVEMAVVMAALGLILLLLSATLVGALRTQKLTAGISNRLMAQSTLADQFRRDVAGAVSAPDSLGDRAASDTRLILRMANDKHVVYDWNNGKLERSEVAGSKRKAQWMAVGSERTTVSFTRSGEARMIGLRLVEPHGREGGELVIEVMSALGGDLR